MKTRAKQSFESFGCAVSGRFICLRRLLAPPMQSLESLIVGSMPLPVGAGGEVCRYRKQPDMRLTQVDTDYDDGI